MPELDELDRSATTARYDCLLFNYEFFPVFSQMPHNLQNYEKLNYRQKVPSV
jgi:hypothetical protein